jgi:hypothetical protein
MCMITRPVEEIRNTCIFARLDHQGSQYLVYSMDANFPSDLAMVLPLPVDRAVDDEQRFEFIDLSETHKFFWKMEGCFSQRIRPDRTNKEERFMGGRGTGKTLPVIPLGDFEATYVPEFADFDRLDPRFRLDPDIWSSLPQYKDYAFAVFKFRGGLHAGLQEIHPMAMRFSTCLDSQLFFPTVHVHDGVFHKEEHFDHQLFCQSGSKPDDWEASAKKFLVERGYRTFSRKASKSGTLKGTVNQRLPGFRKVIQGVCPNQDVIVRATPVDDPVIHRVDGQVESTLRPGLSRKNFL